MASRLDMGRKKEGEVSVLPECKVGPRVRGDKAEGRWQS